MNRLALRTECRRFLDDTVEPYEISDDALNTRIDEAIREACVRASLIIDSTTAETCNIEVIAGTNEYTISPLVLDITRASLPSASMPLRKLGYKEFDEMSRNWETDTGTPNSYLLNMDEGKLKLYPNPKGANEILQLTVNRLPLAGLVDDDAEPEFKEAYHYDLVWWVLHLTYLTRDSEIFNPAASSEFEVKFERRFGSRTPANLIERNRRAYRRRGRAQWL